MAWSPCRMRNNGETFKLRCEVSLPAAATLELLFWRLNVGTRCRFVVPAHYSTKPVEIVTAI